MPRVYIPTGRPPGRPKKPPPAAPPAELKLLDLPAVDVEGITDPEKKMRSALSQIMGGLHSQMPEALKAAQVKKPELVVQFYRDLIEFLAPKLSRLEQNVTGDVKHSHFVAVESREEDPRIIDSVCSEVLEHKDAS